MTWRQQAACRGTDTSVFFPGPGCSNTPAKQICEGCPVRRLCLEDVLWDTTIDGVFGGMSGDERVQERDRRKRLRRVS